jgi:hypothetical protein
MVHPVKFENLESEFVDLPEVFKNSLQNEVLEIKKLNKASEKFQHVSKDICNIDKAEYVIFSKFMGKEFHQNETFIFVNHTGKMICNLSGRELDLHNMISDCDNLVESEEYTYNHK